MPADHDHSPVGDAPSDAGLTGELSSDVTSGGADDEHVETGPAVVDGQVSYAGSWYHEDDAWHADWQLAELDNAHPVPHRTSVQVRRNLALIVLATFAAVQLVGGVAPLPPLAVPAGALPASHTETLYETLSGSVVTISVDDGGIGTGFFYRPGQVLTNLHVVASSAYVRTELQSGREPEVVVVLSDGRVREGRVTLADPFLDLAVIDVDGADDIAPLVLADGHPKVGQPVWVLGAPFGLAGSISAGIVSGIDRNTPFRASDAQTNLIQTDAATNPGNSGGPLVDAAGTVVGIVTLRPDEAEGRSVVGVSFALPTDLVRASLAQLEDTGTVRWPLLGVVARSATSDDPVAAGAVVAEIVGGSPAEQAGIDIGDVIVSVDGNDIAGYESLVRALAGARVGDEIGIELVRDGRQVRFDVELTEESVR